MIGLPAILIHSWVLPVFLAVVIVAVALVVFAARARSRRWKTLLGLGAPLLIVASCVGLFQIDHYHAPLVNVPAPVPTSLSLIVSQYETSNSDSVGVYSINAHDGSVRWHRSLGANSGLWAVQDQIIYADCQGTVCALRASDGKLLWQNPLGLPPPASSPGGGAVVADGMLYLSADDIGAGYQMGRIYALRISDGTLAWSQILDSFSTSYIVQSLAAGGGLLYVGSVNGRLRALRPVDGSLAWTWHAENEASTALPTFADGAVYVRVQQPQGMVTALRASDGTPQWSVPVGIIQGPLTVAGQHLYIVGSAGNVLSGESFHTYLYALDTGGQIRWKYLVVNADGARAVEAGNAVYLASNNNLDALRVSDGSHIWRHAANDNAGFSLPAISNGVIFVTTGVIYPRIQITCPNECEPSQALFALRASDSSVYWRYAAPVSSAPTPAFIGTQA